MLQFRFNQEKYTFEIAQNSRGEWKPLHRTNRGYSQEFIGFGGEQQISIFSSGMQSGICHVMVIFSSVDSYHVMYQENVNYRTGGPGCEADAVNRMIRQHEAAEKVSF